eukprot:TRINITY_DN10240_c0_g1_i1.p1 TRINITY_DN10240_c0_g1~~TRINITY_DN10240_c0_g1_i1.p1  ORF type:complete len:391 (-),score=53.14 TRINITY_DN10240_c0_g1_i1:29-1201(-)
MSEDHPASSGAKRKRSELASGTQPESEIEEGQTQNSVAESGEFRPPSKKSKTQDGDESYDNRTTVIVRGLPKQMDARILGDLMGSAGSLRGIRISTSGDRHHEHRGFAYVSYFDGKDAESAIMKLNRTHVDGHQISVEFVRCFRCGKDGHFTRECPFVETPSSRRRTSSARPSLSADGSSLQMLASQTQHSQPDAPSVLDLSHTSHEAQAASQLFGSESQVLQSPESSIKIETQPSLHSLPHDSLSRGASQSLKREDSHPLMAEISDADMLEALVQLDQHSQHDIETLFDATHTPTMEQPSQSSDSPQIIEHLTKRQLRLGLQVLQELEALLEDHQDDLDAIRLKILDMTNKFYSLVPHKFQTNKRPELLNDLEVVQAKIHKIEDLMQVY